MLAEAARKRLDHSSFTERRQFRRAPRVSTDMYLREIELGESF